MILVFFFSSPSQRAEHGTIAMGGVWRGGVVATTC